MQARQEFGPAVDLSNPCGTDLAAFARLSEEEGVARLITQHGIPVIESGVCNELHHGDSPPSTIKEHDTEGLVLHCSSLSKTVSAGARIGWALPGRYRQQVARLKFLNTSGIAWA